MSQLGVDLAPTEIELEGGARVQVDAVSPGRDVFAEIFARQGKLKPGQQKKVAIDTLKLITLKRQYDQGRLLLVFCDEEAAEYARGKGWLARALDAWGVEVVVVDIDQALRAEIVATQQRQMMVNSDDEDEATTELA